MAIQGRRPGWQPYGPSGIPQGDQDLLTPRNLVHGPDEGTFEARFGRAAADVLYR
jgi:hypothetical protein